MLEHVEPKPKTVKIPGPDHPIGRAQRESGRGDGGRPYCGRYAEGVDAPGGELPSCPIHPAQGRGHDAARANGPRHLLPLQGRLRILQHSAGRCALHQRAVWTYESPYAAVAAIRDYLAFYPDRVDAIEERPGRLTALPADAAEDDDSKVDSS